MKSSPKKTPPSDHVPGPMEEAAVRAYFERGSKQAVDGNRWRIAAIGSLLTVMMLSAGIAVMALKQNIYVMQVSKDVSGQLQVGGVASKFEADESTQMAWALSYAQILTEITPAIWRRNVDRTMSLSVGVSQDQVRSYLQQINTNPAAILSKNELYVREFKRKSINKIANNTYLVRYELTSRIAPSAQPEKKSYSMTISLTNVGHATREDVFRNPEGLAALNFSISEDKGN